MAVTYGFFNSVNGDRKYNAEQMSEYFRGIINEGVYQHLDGGLAVTAGTGLAVNVAAGRAIIQNRWIQNSAAMSLTIAAASETYARKDAVVIRLNWSSRAISITVKTGTPAASPVAPSMTRNATTYEMALAYVNVAAGASSVTVTDKRSDSSVCGWASVAQSTSGEVDQMLNDMKTGFDGVVYPSPAAMVQGCDQLLQDQIDDVNDAAELVENTFDYADTYTPESLSFSADVKNYWSASGTTTAPDWEHASIAATAGTTYYITGNSYLQYRCYVFVPSSGDNVYYPVDAINAYKFYDRIAFTAPSNGTLYVNVYSDGGYTGKIEQRTGHAIYSLKDLYLATQIKGKKWGVIGDSLSDHSTLGSSVKIYTDYIADAYGMTVNDVAVGGTGYMKGGANNFVAQSQTIATDCDFVTVFGSFNDWSDAYDHIGAIGDTGTTTLYGCVYNVYNNIKTRCPDAKIGFILPTPWGSYNNVNSTSYSVNTKIPEFLGAIKNTAKKFGIPVLNLYELSQLRPWEEAFQTKWYKDYAPGDSVHPNTDAHKKYLTPLITDFLRNM